MSKKSEPRQPATVRQLADTLIRSMNLLMLISDQMTYHTERYQYPKSRAVPVRLFELLEEQLGDHLAGRPAEDLRGAVTLLAECVETLSTQTSYRPTSAGAQSAARCSTRATLLSMARRITQRELRNQSGEVMRGLDGGEEFLVTRNGVAVGRLEPLQRRRFVAAEQALAAFRGAAPVNLGDLRSDLDAVVEQDPEPRG